MILYPLDGLLYIVSRKIWLLSILHATFVIHFNSSNKKSECIRTVTRRLWCLPITRFFFSCLRPISFCMSLPSKRHFTRILSHLDANICTPLLGKGNQSKRRIGYQGFQKSRCFNLLGLQCMFISHSNCTPTTGQLPPRQCCLHSGTQAVELPALRCFWRG